MIGSLFQLTTTLLVLVIVSQLSSFTLSNPSTSSSSALTSTYLPPYSLLYCTDSKEYCLYSRQIAQNSTIQLLLAAQKTTLWAAFGFGSSMMQADVFLSWPNTGNKGVTVSRRVAQGKFFSEIITFFNVNTHSKHYLLYIFISPKVSTFLLVFLLQNSWITRWMGTLLIKVEIGSE